MPNDLEEFERLARESMRGARHDEPLLGHIAIRVAAEVRELRRQRDEARAHAHALAHSYWHRSSPPHTAVDAALAYPVDPAPPRENAPDP